MTHFGFFSLGPNGMLIFNGTSEIKSYPIIHRLGAHSIKGPERVSCGSKTLRNCRAPMYLLGQFRFSLEWQDGKGGAVRLRPGGVHTSGAIGPRGRYEEGERKWPEILWKMLPRTEGVELCLQTLRW